jgi:lipopolysaccharide cholinephosphotransferase
VEDSKTVIDDPWVNLPLENKLGLSIDIFPIVSCTEKEGEEAAIKVQKLIFKERIRMVAQNASFLKKFAKRVLGFFSFGNYLKERRQIKTIIDEMPSGDCFCNIVSPQFWKIIWPKDTFNELDEYVFEDTKLLGPKDYDAYLTRCYKNYMQLPPEEKRRVHALGVYYRNDVK